VFSAVYRTVTAGLLGKDTSEVDPDSMLFNERMMYHFNMGYSTPNGRNPFSSVAYYEAEHKFFHPWSHNSNAKRYGYNKLKEILPLRDYLELPIHIVDEYIDGLVEGETARFEAEKARDKEADTPLKREQAALIKQLGLDKAFK